MDKEKSTATVESGMKAIKDHVGAIIKDRNKRRKEIEERAKAIRAAHHQIIHQEDRSEDDDDDELTV